ncbi:DNA polymerase III subunit chi [Tsuneonella sp. HG222]
MQLNFWQFTQGPVERIVAMIAARAMDQGERLLVVDADDARRQAISSLLWETKPEAFLANGDAAEPGAERQPILLARTPQAANGARFAILADGIWREEAIGFDRTILLFDEAGAEDARIVWRLFAGREDVTPGYFAQEGGKWVKKA